jgi:hypothetical protein
MEFAFAAGVSLSVISFLERGHGATKKFSPRLCGKLAIAYGVSIEEIEQACGNAPKHAASA